LDSDPETGSETGIAFDLPGAIDWLPNTPETPRYTFLPDGRADGPVLEFTLRKRNFILELDALTGRMRVSELE